MMQRFSGLHVGSQGCTVPRRFKCGRRCLHLGAAACLPARATCGARPRRCGARAGRVPGRPGSTGTGRPCPALTQTSWPAGTRSSCGGRGIRPERVSAGRPTLAHSGANSRTLATVSSQLLWGGLLGLPAEGAACPRGGLVLPRRGILPLHVANSKGDAGNGWRARRPLALPAVAHARVHLRSCTRSMVAGRQSSQWFALTRRACCVPCLDTAVAWQPLCMLCGHTGSAHPACAPPCPCHRC